MFNLNRCEIIGNLGSNPETRYTTTGQAVAELSVATNARWKDDDGKRQEHTEWHRVVVWGSAAENAAKYLKKGSTVRIVGRLQTRKWDDKDGITRYTTEIVASEVNYLDRVSPDAKRGASDSAPEAPADAEPF
jgi:single-strand DNA-binding protein